ncbi:F0F1 ATP synthase subunit gamma [Undibacterium sp. RTI2.1]|uniref:F0F1 ATP synthase subunit gamma n=1 Tax=unclassified Undibacterium TaxID=2630295 RepID=UPI002B236331|nr:MULTISPECIES: F0F1 ATP synthase subunit gamma [unclassified Undibacterium]MEB0032158.1 F0F1 ATP synthase subunit gamma [Undibacterium sp. RTI2.1]MEB0118312.1 F0F1 ATP synthase subunit gamma [Undibacterium sp. RTI2.2]
MSDTMTSLRHKIDSAANLQSVVRTMKAVAASSIGQYENALRSLDDYYRTVQLGLTACLRQNAPAVPSSTLQKKADGIGAIVFGSDQGLVGQFNDVMVDFVDTTLALLPGKKMVWAVGERIESRLAETKMVAERSFSLPNSTSTISILVGEILIAIEAIREQGSVTQIYLFYNRRISGSTYAPVSRRLLPFDDVWRRDLAVVDWPTKNLPEIMNQKNEALLAFVREYLFVTVFMACAQSLASENASRLSAMQRAEKNIEELLDDLNRSFHQQRQSGIDEELFDVISGFAAFVKS